jgi:D-glycero-alpha-D-manno-heptose-7-phosphate kinase
LSVITTRAPLRISLGGGGTDLPSFYREHGGFLVAGAIDKYVYMMAHTVFQQRYRMKYSEFEEVAEAKDIKHPLLRECITRHWRGAPLEIASLADVPAGTGLGSSGSFTVALLQALALARRVSVTPQTLAEQACEIEIDILGEPVGKQDQYVAAHGGICTYTFHQDDTVTVEPLELPEATLGELRNNLLLFYTGASRSASGILADQVEKTRQGDDDMLDNLKRIKDMGYESARLLSSGDLFGYAELMHEHWQIKRRRSPGMTDEHIDDLYTLARRSGVVGGKLVGA